MIERGDGGQTRFYTLAVACTLLAGAILRAGILLSPRGEVEADESVVGLMALHILGGDHSVFYWGQPLLGSLEAYLVALAFSVTGPSNLVLKVVPGVVFLLYALLLHRATRQALGSLPALFVLVYLAIPPSFLAIWSLKARGGYVELLALGQALILLTPWALSERSGRAARLGAYGLVSGVLIWTHLLGLIFLLPSLTLVVKRIGRGLVSGAGLLLIGGFLVGLSPAIVYNLQHDFETITNLVGSGQKQPAWADNLLAFYSIALPILAGFGQASTSPTLLLDDWTHRPASWPWTPPLVLVLLLVGALPALLAVARNRWRGRRSDPVLSLSLAILALTPLLTTIGRLGQLVVEPRYALPIYSALPLYAFALARLCHAHRRIGLLAAAGVLAINVFSIATLEPGLLMPTSASGSTQANRAELLRYLERSELTEIYTDYWLAYPLMFESEERVLAAVISGGYDRLDAFSYYVAVSKRPAFVFIEGSAEEASFLRRMAQVQGRARRDVVSIYSAYSDAEPIDQLRPVR